MHSHFWCVAACFRLLMLLCVVVGCGQSGPDTRETIERALTEAELERRDFLLDELVTGTTEEDYISAFSGRPLEDFEELVSLADRVSPARYKRAGVIKDAETHTFFLGDRIEGDRTLSLTVIDNVIDHLYLGHIFR